MTAARATVTHLPGSPTVPTLAAAVPRFCRRDRFEPSTVESYRKTLNYLLAAVGDQPVDTVTTDQVEKLLYDRWSEVAPATFNRHRSGLLAFFAWCVKQGWRHDNPVTRVESRKLRRRTEAAQLDRPISREYLDALWCLDGVAGRHRLLFRMAYETWSRANELLGLDIADLNPRKMEGVVTGKGGDREFVYWSTGTARLLPRVIGDRTSGPLFLAAKLPTRPMPAADLDPTSGKARLSYRRAEELLVEAGRRIKNDPNEPDFTLHRLRHSGISHAVEAGWNLAQVRAKSRHASLKALQVYTTVGPEAVATMTASLDPEARRR